MMLVVATLMLTLGTDPVIAKLALNLSVSSNTPSFMSGMCRDSGIEAGPIVMSMVEEIDP